MVESQLDRGRFNGLEQSVFGDFAIFEMSRGCERGSAVVSGRRELYAAAMNENQSVAKSGGNRARSPCLLDRSRSSLLIVDLQEKLFPLIERRAIVEWNIGRLLAAAKLLRVHVAASEQYPAGLGPTIESVRRELGTVPDKRMFSCRECGVLFEQWTKSGTEQLVVVGIETHVCILQTALDLLSAGFDVFVPADAVGSRFAADREIGLQRLSLAGVTVTTTEATLFEWCETAAAPEFKAISQLVRQAAPV
jgi:nicotinamidase-related amidase